jgi:hypothetical protein
MRPGVFILTFGNPQRFAKGSFFNREFRIQKNHLVDNLYNWIKTNGKNCELPLANLKRIAKG